MEGCAGCFQTQKGIDRALNVAISEARQKAIEDSKPVAIVMENNEYIFYDPFYAYQNNIPVKQVVSHL